MGLDERKATENFESAISRQLFSHDRSARSRNVGYRSLVYRKWGGKAYQGGGEDGEDAEAEDDAVARRLGEDRDAAEEAVFGKAVRSAFSLSVRLYFYFPSRVAETRAKGHQAKEDARAIGLGDSEIIARGAGRGGVRVKPHGDPSCRPRQRRSNTRRGQEFRRAFRR